MINIELTQDEAQAAQEFVYNHMQNCMMSLDFDSEADVPEGFKEPYGVFCGCDVREGREMMMAFVDWFRTNKEVDIYVV